MNVREMMDKRAALIGQARELMTKAEDEQRDFNDVEETQYREWMQEVDGLEGKIQRAQDLEHREASIAPAARPQRQSAGLPGGGYDAPNINTKTKPGDNETRAIAYYVRTGDPSSLRGIEREAASNNNDMTIADPTYAGYAVPTGHYQGIIAKQNELALFTVLGVMDIPGKGTTVNVPYDSGGAQLFVSTAETNAFDRDAPVLGQATMTLVKYTKNVEISNELLEDEDSKLVAFLDNYVGRSLALTHNKLLVTEALADGTSVAMGDDTTPTSTDVAALIYALQGEYADSAQWVMARATEGKYRALTGSVFQFASTETPLSGRNDPLWGFPVRYSAYVPAIGAGNKSLIFGNFGYMGMRTGGLTFLRNPYLLGSTGQVVLHYYARIVYKVLNSDAILYGHNPTA